MDCNSSTVLFNTFVSFYFFTLYSSARIFFKNLHPQIVKISCNMALTLALVTCLFTIVHATTYAVDDTVGVARQYDGIGGLSGGSVSFTL